MWDNHVPAKWKDRAPKLVTKDDGSNLWVFEGGQIPNVGLNAVSGRPPEEYGMEPTALTQLRPGCYDVDERVADMNANGVLGSLCFPTVPGFVGELLNPAEPPLPKGSPLVSISVAYPEAGPMFFDLSMWVWIFFGLTIVVAFLLRKPLGVTI